MRLVWKVERKAARVAEPSIATTTPPPTAPENPGQAKPDPAASLAPDRLSWLHVARQFLAGEFDGADCSPVESRAIGLRGIPDPLTRRALDWLQTHFAKA